MTPTVSTATNAAGTVADAAPDPHGRAASILLDNRRSRRLDLVAAADLRWRDLGALLVLVFSIEVRRPDSILTPTVTA